MALAMLAEELPDREFVRSVVGERRTFHEFHERSLRCAAVFRDLGVIAGDNVVTMLPTTPTSLEVWIGLCWLRAREIALNPALGEHFIRSLLGDLEPRMFVASREHVALLEALHLEGGAPIVCIDDNQSSAGAVSATIDGDRPVEATEPAADLTPPEAHDTSCVIFTSGTTGVSKGVIIPWGVFTGTARVFGDLSLDDVYYCHSGMYHISSRGPFAHMALCGGRLLTRPSFKTQAFWSDIRSHGCTATHLVPAMVRWLLEQPPSACDRTHGLTSVMTAPVDRSVEAFRDRFGVRVRTAYGLTEAPTVVFAGPDEQIPTGSCGQVTPGYEVRLVDEYDYEKPDGEVGEFVVRSSAPWRLNSGYLGMPLESARAWRNGWYHTGDLGYRDADGYYYYSGRLKDSIRRRGENISAFEVELAINEYHAVLESAVVGVPSSEGENEVKAFVVLRHGEDVSASSLSDHVAARLPAFMVPRLWQFVVGLPRTEVTRRVMKSALQDYEDAEKTWDSRGEQ